MECVPSVNVAWAPWPVESRRGRRAESPEEVRFLSILFAGPYKLEAQASGSDDEEPTRLRFELVVRLQCVHPCVSEAGLLEEAGLLLFLELLCQMPHPQPAATR